MFDEQKLITPSAVPVTKKRREIVIVDEKVEVGKMDKSVHEAIPGNRATVGQENPKDSTREEPLQPDDFFVLEESESTKHDLTTSSR